MDNTIKKKIGKATAWSSITELMAKIISPIVNMILARLLTPDAFGIVATITMVVSFAEVFSDAGFQKYIIQKEFESDEDLDKSTNVAFWTNLFISILACFIIFLFRHNIADIVGSPGLGDSLSIASLLIILHAFSSIQMARYKRDFNFKGLFFARIAVSLIPLVITIPVALLLKNYWAILIGNFASQIFNVIFLMINSKWKPKFFYSFDLFKKMFSFSFWTLLESISIWLTSNLDIFIVGSVLSDYYLGLYKTSMTTINSYMGLITAAIIPVLFSALSRNQNNEKEFRHTFNLFQKFTALFVIPMGVVVYLYRDFVTLILLGDQWIEAADFIGLWGLTSAINIVFSHFASEVYRSKGKPIISLFVQISQITFLLPSLLLVANEGFENLILIRSIVRLELSICAIFILLFVFKFKVSDLIKNIIPAFISSVIMGIFGFFVLQLSSNIIWQIISILLCVIVYFVIVLVFFKKTREEIFNLQIVKKFLKRK